jgi:integrase
LTLAQAQKLIETLKGHRFEGVFIIGLLTGMRLGEITGLRWQDIDFEKGGLQVRRTVTYYARYGYIESEPKSAKSKRPIMLSPLLIEVLKLHRTRQLTARIKAGPVWSDRDLVFCVRHGGYINPNDVRNALSNVLATADLPGIKFHDLRHSAASLLLAMGIHPKVVQELLGHSTISMTMDIYSHVIPSLQREAVEKLSALFQASGG